MAQVEPVEPFHGTEQNLRFALTMYWDTGTLTWVKGTQGSGGGGGGGGTEYTQDAAAPANPVGGVRQVVRVDTPSAVGADGDIVTQKGTAYGAAYVTLLDSSGATPTIGGGVQYTQGDTDASITGTAMLMEGAGDTLLTVPGSTADGILVNLGSNNDVTVAAIPALGQAAMAASLPVVIASDQTAVLVSLSTSIKNSYVASSAVTISPASLATDANFLAGRESTAVDNSTNKYTDYLLSGQITTGTTPTVDKEIRVYVVGISNDSTWPDVFDGTDSAETITNVGIRDSICRLAAVMRVTATSNVAYWFGPVSVALLFGGVLPLKFVVFVTHNTAVNLNSTAGNHVVSITPVYQTIA